MADNKIKHKRNVTNTNDPAANGLDVGELAIGAVAGKLYTKKQDGTVITFTGIPLIIFSNVHARC